MYWRGEYEPATLALFEKILRPGDIVVDVGANLGLMTLHASKEVGPSGKVIAIEAHPATYARLKRNLELNNCDNVSAFNFAAGASVEERAIFDVPSLNIGRSSLIAPDEDHSIGGIAKVKRLDDILDGIGILSVRLIKIDVEGFESEVIRGATRTIQLCPIICMEVVTSIPCENGADPLGAHDLIMKTGLFDCYRFKGTKFTSSPLVRVSSRNDLSNMHDNLIYIPISRLSDLPGDVFN